MRQVRGRVQPRDSVCLSVLVLSVGMNWLEVSFPGLINPFSHLFSVRPSQETVFSTIKHPVSSKWSRACREGHEEGAASGSHMLSSEVCSQPLQQSQTDACSCPLTHRPLRGVCVPYNWSGSLWDSLGDSDKAQVLLLCTFLSHPLSSPSPQILGTYWTLGNA